MYLSRLLINAGDNPDQPRPGRSWLRNRYRVHQRLCMAFPSGTQKTRDPDFLQPFKPDEFGQDQVYIKCSSDQDQVHKKRSSDSNFLFRIDPLSNGRVMIIVQSAVEPDWGYAFHNADYLLAAPPGVKQFDPRFSKDQRLRFRLAANPTKRLSEKSPDLKKQESIGKRVPVPACQLVDWLARRGESVGFSINSATASSSYVHVDKNKPSNANDNADENQKGKGPKGIRLFSVQFDGILQVTDPDAFREALVQGIGPGKAFGFGLLSVAPLAVPGAEEAV
ncbi:MAG: CRISPR-associated endoribonuclease Cse3 [Myxococcota bacterium]|nr:CRISPR-associated endoribonuclease Cse3 [Myxococcota bacterium]